MTSKQEIIKLLDKADDEQFGMMLYLMWVENEDYSKQSSLENSVYDTYSEQIRNVVGESMFHEIIDFVTNLACAAEQAGFESGLRYGMMLMIDILKGGTVN